MAKSRLEYIKSNIKWTMFTNVISMVCSFLIRTLMLQYLSSEFLGLNGLCTSILYVFNAAEFGVSNAFVYKLYKPVANHETETVCRLLFFYKKIYKLIGFTILGMGVIVLPFLPRLIKGTPPEGVNLYVVFVLFLLNTVISYLTYSYKSLLLLANQRKDLDDMCITVSFVFMYGVQIISLVNSNYYLFVCVMPITTLLLNICRGIIVDYKYPDYRCKGKITQTEVKEMSEQVFSAAVYKIRDISRTSFDNIIISKICGLLVLAYYQNYYTVLTVPLLLRSIVVNAIAPSMGNLAATESKENIYKAYKLFVGCFLCISAWFTTIYGCLIQDFIRLWVGNQYLMSNHMVFLLSVYYYLLGYTEITKIMREAVGLWDKGKLFATAEMIANIILNILLSYLFGVEGIVLASIITIVFINVPFETKIVYHGFFQVKRVEIIKIYGVYILETCLLWLICSYLCNLIHFARFFSFFIKTIICGAVPFVLLILFNLNMTKEIKSLHVK